MRLQILHIIYEQGNERYTVNSTLNIACSELESLRARLRKLQNADEVYFIMKEVPE